MEPMTWFGTSWGAPINDTCEQVAVPVGELCEWCEEPIRETESGIMLDSLGVDGIRRAAYHVECQTRSVVGGYNHLKGRCMCCGGTEPPDPPELSKRDAAKLAAMYFGLGTHRYLDDRDDDQHWMLDGHTPVRTSFLRWGLWYDTADRQVGFAEVGPYRVSTIFLGLNHDLSGDGPPILFETMIFGPVEPEVLAERIASFTRLGVSEELAPQVAGHEEALTWRYATWDEAEQGHQEGVALVRLRLAAMEQAVNEAEQRSQARNDHQGGTN